MGIRKKPESAGINLNPTQKVVTYLLGLLPKAAYHVFLNNLFSSLKLFVILRESGIGALGITRANYNRPKGPIRYLRSISQAGLLKNGVIEDRRY